MRIVAIGDPHGDINSVRKIPVEGADLILLTGDLGSADLMRKRAFQNIERRKNGLPEMEFSPRQRRAAFMEAYNSSMKVVKYLSRFAPVYTIYGNVESSNTYTRKLSKEIKLPLPLLTDSLNNIENVKVINNKLVGFEGIKIGGLEYFVDTNWVRDFKPNDYKKRLKSARKETDKAKHALRRFGNVNILVCHQPPYGILDKVTAKFAPKHWQGKNAGSKTIRDYIQGKKPSYVFCGHIHEGEGKARMGSTEVYNLGVCGYKILDLK